MIETLDGIPLNSIKVIEEKENMALYDRLSDKSIYSALDMRLII